MPGRRGSARGVRVLDFSRLVAGNMLSLQLADFGAEVVKVETPGRGDTLRDWREAGVSVHWKVYARNKKSITLNLKSPEAPGDRPRPRRALRRADRELPLPLSRAARRRPRARCSRAIRGWSLVRVSGFGQTGPVREAPGLRHARRGDVGLRLAQRLRGPRAGAAAARHGRHDRGTLRRHGDGHRRAQRRDQRRPRPGHRPEPARLDLLDPRARGRDPQAHAARSAGASAARRRRTSPRNVYATKRRRLGRHLRLDAGDDRAAVPRHRPRRPERGPEVQDQRRAHQAARRRSTPSSAASSASARWPTPSRSSRRRA